MLGHDSPPAMTLLPRDVPLGGPRAMNVRRTLPHRDIRTIGAWCFVDDYGPTTPDQPPMDVRPHPHMGLQTVTWLMTGEVEHRDSTGGHGLVQPEQLNLMTAGHGIAHSEYSRSGVVRGVQMWVALPADMRHGQPSFAQYRDLPRVSLTDDFPVNAEPEAGAEATAGVAEALVFIGEFGGVRSPAATFTPLVGVQIRTLGNCSVQLPLRSDFEYGILALDEDLFVDATPVPRHSLRYLGWGHDSLTIDTATASVFLLLGGEPLVEELLMWWNFVGRTHDEIEQARAQWQAGERFGAVVGDDARPLPAPVLPNGQLRPRPGRAT